jgi:hypothetical protein
MGLSTTTGIARSVAAVACLTLLAGCSGQRSVGFYRSHPAWRARVADECIATGSQTSNCRNAIQASFDALHIPAHNGRADPAPYSSPLPSKS